MQDRIIKVFYGNDCLPYKDSDRSVHYPILGNSFQGSSNVTELRFYTRDIGGTNRQWIVIGKLPNGKKGFKILGSAVYDDELNEYYYSFLLTDFFTQYKGALFLCLGGYIGNLVLQEEFEYELSQTLVETTGALKIDIAYSTQINESDTDIDNWQDYLEALGGKLDTTKGIVVIDNTSVSVGGYNEGQLFYSLADNKYYILDSGSLVLSTNPLQNDIGIVQVNSNTDSTITDSEYLKVAKKHCIIIDTYINETYQKENISGGIVYFKQTYDINSSGTYSVASKKYIGVNQTSVGGVHTIAFASKTTNLYDKTQAENYVASQLNPHLEDYQELYEEVNGSDDVVGIVEKIPPQASATNQLADKDFVNSTVNSLVAFYITKNAQGDPFATYSELASATTFYSGGEVRVPTRNDYCLVVADETHPIQANDYTTFNNTNEYVGYYVSYNSVLTLVTHDNKDSLGIVAGTTIAYITNASTCRYIYQGTQWEFQFIVNETPFTSDQLKAINSGITDSLVAQITTNANNISTLNGKLPKMLNVVIEASEWQLVSGTETQYQVEINASDYDLVLSATDLKIYTPKLITDQVLIDTYNIQVSSDDTNNKFVVNAYYGQPNSTFNLNISVMSGTTLEPIGE